MTRPPALSLVVPAFNEEKRLGGTLARVLEYLSAQPYTWELLVVDDGSGDATGDVARASAGLQNQRSPRAGSIRTDS